jgi:hypothetical protein
MKRRSFIKTVGLAGLGLATKAQAFGMSGQVHFALLDGGEPQTRLAAWQRLGLELEARTSISVAPKPLIIDSASDELFDYPLLICCGLSGLPNWNSQRWARLAHYLRSGGMIYFDGLAADGGFAGASLERLARQLPAGTLQKTPTDHVLYRSFYLLKTPIGRFSPQVQPEAAILDGRLVALAVEVDLAGALLRDEFGAWAYTCNPGGEPQREQAIRFGVNLLMYALCTDYKADQVHIPFLLKRRR